MITKDDILRMARHIARRGAGKTDRRLIHPARDWFIGFSLSLVLFLVSLAGTGYLFLTKSTLVTEEREVVIDAVKYDERLIEKVRETYAARKEKEEALRAGGAQGGVEINDVNLGNLPGEEAVPTDTGSVAPSAQF